MKKLKNILKIPKNTTVLTCCRTNLLAVLGRKNKKSIKLDLKIKFLNNKKSLYIINSFFFKKSNNKKKKIKSNQGTQLALIKQLFIETSITLHYKLKLVGIGYRVFNVQNSNNKILLFKLGYSHALYFRTPKNLQTITYKLNTLFITGSSYDQITHFSSIIRSYKVPEPYKGKGILYENEKIILKEGKKI